MSEPRAKGTEIPSLASDLAGAFYLAFSPDGRRLMIGASKSEEGQSRSNIISIRELSTGKERVRLTTTLQTCCRASPDGRQLASGGEDGRIHLWEMATGKERRTLTGHRGGICSLSFSTDGKSLASASADTTVLVWDMDEPECAQSEEKAPTPKHLDACWADLAGEDAVRAYHAILTLARSGNAGAAMLRERLRPIPLAGKDRIARLLRRLDADDFETREAASRSLAEMEEAAAPALEKALQDAPSPEAARRLRVLLNRLGSSRLTAARLRALRAVEALERIGTADARRTLRELAAGLPEARLTQEATAALERRPAPRP
jgi:hypothetical protein